MCLCCSPGGCCFCGFNDFCRQFSVLAWKNRKLKLRYCWVLVLEILLPVCIILAFGGIKGVLVPTIVPANIPGKYAVVKSAFGSITSNGIDYSNSFESLFTTSLPTPCTSNLAFYCMNAERAKCNALGPLLFSKMSLQTTLVSCIPQKIAIVNAAGSAAVEASAKDLVSWGNSRVNSVSGSTFNPLKYFSSEAALSACLDSGGYSVTPTDDCPGISAAIILNSAAPSWDYTVRMNQTFYLSGVRYGIPPTKDNVLDQALKTNQDSKGGDRGTNYKPYAQGYVDSGYLSLTDFINSFILSTTFNAGAASTQWAKSVVVQTAGAVKFPHPEVQTTGFWGAIGPYFALVLIIVLLYPLSNVIASLVREKETKLREGMMMMAMRSDAMMLSWWFNFICLFLPLSILLAIVGQAGRSPIFKYSEPLYIFIYFFTFFMGSTAFCVLVSCFFTKSRTASIIGSLLFFGGYFIYIGVSGSGGAIATRSQVLAACLHPAAALTYGTAAFTEYEDAQIGITRFTFNSSNKNPFTFQDIVTMMFIDAFWMSFLAWYVDKIWPSEFGTQKPWYFVFQPHYWYGEFVTMFSCFFGKTKGAHRRVVTPIDPDAPIETSVVEMVTENLNSQLQTGTCVDIQDLYKEFDTPQGGKKVAVNKLNLTMYSGQITALLGHNGAGKTTTIAMLTGLIPADGGSAIIEGYDINENMDEIRRNLGVCPQHDILFPDLTVEEHLILFASFKGAKGNEVKEEVEKMIQSVGLTEKRHVFSKQLSGGQKRKLSVGIAFIGGSRIVFLDEPTSGMDPYSRRFTWNIIRQHREGRVIVLTTHFMDEADLLGDRIAIMGDGKLACCGSSLFLKRQFGVGYNMTLEKKNSTNFNTTQLNSTITSYIPEASVITDAGKEITYQLPFSASTAMPTLFEYIDKSLDFLGLESYGISITTLEEVFIKITQKTHTNQAAEGGRKAEKSKQMKPMSIGYAEAVHDDVEVGTWKETNQGVVDFGKIPEDNNIRYFVRHFYALIVKRALYFLRDKKAWIFTFVVPFCFLLAGMIILKYTKSDYSQPKIRINREMYNTDISNDHLPTPFVNNALGASGSGAMCVENLNSTTGNVYSYCYNYNPTWPVGAVNNVKSAASNPMVPLNQAYSIYNVSQYLWNNRNKYQASTFGAYSFFNAPVDAACTGQSSCEFNYAIHANFTAVHAVPLFNQMLVDGLVRFKDSSASVSVSIEPLNPTKRQSEVLNNYQTDTVVTFLMLAVPFVPAAMATFIVREREVKAKHQQVVSGVGIPAYWLSTFLWDQMTYMFTLFLFVIVICGPVFGADTVALGGDGAYRAQGRLFALLYLFGAAMAGFTYLLCFAFISPTTAQIATIFIVFITGLVLSIIGIVLRILSDTREPYKNFIRYILCLFPPFALGDGLHSMALIDAYSSFELKGGAKYNVLDWEITGLPLMMLGWESVVFLLATILIEWVSSIPSISGVFARIGRTLPPVDPSKKDADVLEEERRVQSGEAFDSTILVNDFKKMYGGGKYAVKGVSLGIPNGECFGLLGINGAGKSTTLSMLSGEFPPTSGEASLAGLNLLTDVHTCRRKIGFCPQFDSIFELLTGREHLELYARIKGINDEDIERVVETKIREMGLTEYANRYAGTYSGGNKRKLSVAIAMIGEPRIVFLDEPSTGMDPVARRFMWDVITDIVTKKEKCSLILTTHSMEECEALCTRIGIMVGGVLRCLGSTQHLRSLYGDGFQIEIGMILPTPEAISSHSVLLLGLIGVQIDTSSDFALTKEQLFAIFAKLKKDQWVSRVNADGTGNDLHSTLESAKSISIKHVASWCLLEVIYDDISIFLASTFNEYTQRERQPSKIRVEISARLADGSPRLLSQTFGALENNKARLQIQEYSIAQTSLEQIFNGFASQQEEELGPAAGIGKKSS